jgi:uncharacterized protein (DUF2147 family)
MDLQMPFLPGKKCEERFARARIRTSAEFAGRNDMKGRLNLVVGSALVLISAMVFAQTSQAQEAQAGAAANAQANASANEKNQAAQGSLAAGTAINAELDKSLDSKKAKVGDAVTARTTEAIKEDGKVVLPKGTKLIGHVRRASARSKGDGDSTLAVQFDRAEMKGGQEIPVQLNVQAMAAAPGVAAIGGDDLQGMGSAGAGASAGGRGAAGGVASTVGGAASGAASTVPRTTQGAAGTVNSTVNSTTGVAADASGAAGAAAQGPSQGAVGGVNSSGHLMANSRGVFGLSGLSLNADTSNAPQGSVIASAGKSVQLDSGTRLLLVAQSNTSAAAQR